MVHKIILIFQPILKYFTLNSRWVTKWRSKGLSNESLEALSSSSNTLNPLINYYGDKLRLKFSRSILRQKRVTYNDKKMVNTYVVYEITSFPNIYSNPTLTNILFRAVKLTKNADIDIYKYSGYGIGFDNKGFYSYPGDGTGKNVIIFATDMTSSIEIDNKGKDILILGRDPTQGLGERSLSAEKMYSINFTKENTKFSLSLHYNEANSYLFVNGTEIHKFKAKDSVIIPNNLCLENVSKDFSLSNMKKTGFNGYIYDFTVDYDSIEVFDIFINI